MEEIMVCERKGQVDRSDDGVDYDGVGEERGK